MKIALALAFSLFVALGCRAQETLQVAEVDRYLKRMEAFGFSGAIAIMHKGEIVLERGYGLADRAKNVPVTPETLFDIGSIVKTFTATAIQHYVDSGQISLDDTLPKFFDDVPVDKRAITLRQLMTHTAGLPLYTGEDYELIPREKMVSMAFGEKLRFEPGTKWGYCNSCYSLLATIVEKLSGKPYELYVHERLLAPSGLTQTGYVIPNFLGRNVARGYELGRDDGTPLEKAWYGDGPSWSLRGNGGFLSNVRELARWARAFETTKVASDATRARAAEAVIDTGRGPDEKMGYGWFVQTTPQGRLVSHSGGNGIFANNLRRYVDRDVIVAMSTNHYAMWNPNERNAITLLFGGTVPMPPEASGTVPVARLAGRYRLPNGGELELRARDGQLVLDPMSSVDAARLVLPPNVLTTERAKELEAKAKTFFEQMAKGDISLLEKNLIPGVAAADEAKFWKGWMEESEKRFGKFARATPLWTVKAATTDDLHTYVLMHFVNGNTAVRWEERQNGVFAHAFPRYFPDAYRFIARGENELVTWNSTIGASGSLRYEKDAIVLGGIRATRVVP